jgi:two-component system, cell cycle sensor histidine kinase and response regulator CckA
MLNIQAILYDGAEINSSDVQSEIVNRGRNPMKVLLVDDEEMIVDVGQRMLSRLGYEVLIAKSGHEALSIYRDNADSIGLVVLDMVLPEMSGGEIYDRLRQMNSQVKVILSSGYGLDSKTSEILSRGCSGFIQKPFNLQSLSETIQKVLNET